MIHFLCVNAALRHAGPYLTNATWHCHKPFSQKVKRCVRADSRFAPSQWEMALLCNDVSHWLGANLESALCVAIGSKACDTVTSHWSVRARVLVALSFLRNATPWSVLHHNRAIQSAHVLDIQKTTSYLLLLYYFISPLAKYIDTSNIYCPLLGIKFMQFWVLLHCSLDKIADCHFEMYFVENFTQLNF